MKFTSPVGAIVGPLQQVAGISVANPKNPDDLFPYVLIEVTKESVSFTGSDGAVQLQAVLPLPEGACESEGKFLIEAHKVSEFFRTLTDKVVTIELAEDGESINVTSEQSHYTLRVKQLADDQTFPLFAMGTDGEVKHFSVEGAKLRFMFEKSTFCVCRDNYRQYLMGVRLEIKDTKLCLFALDGHRMAALEVALPEPADCEMAPLMTLRGVSELQKLLPTDVKEVVRFDVTPRFIATKIGCFTLTNQLLNTKYPNVRSVIPHDCRPEIPVSLEELKQRVKVVSLFSNKRMNHINLTFSKDKLTLFSQNSDHEVGKAEIPIDFDDQGIPREINLNADYLKDFLNVLEGKEVVFGFAPPYQNTLLRPTQEHNEQGIRIRYVVSHIMV